MGHSADGRGAGRADSAPAERPRSDQQPTGAAAQRQSGASGGGESRGENGSGGGGEGREEVGSYSLAPPLVCQDRAQHWQVQVTLPRAVTLASGGGVEGEVVQGWRRDTH